MSAARSTSEPSSGAEFLAVVTFELNRTRFGLLAEAVPSANHLFASAADQFGRTAVGVILTGMDDDGCTGFAALRREGGRIPVQDEKTSVVFGMPTLRALMTTGEP